MDHNALDAYRVDAAVVLKEFKTRASGLSTTEATEKLIATGPNKLEKVNRTPLIIKFLRQFRDLMIILLLASAAIAFYLSDTRTTIILVILVFINAMIGFSQEYKAERIMDSLEKLVKPMTRVRRDGVLKEVESATLVAGDIIYIEEGDSVPADLRLIQETELSTNDFALTGESNPSRKFVHAIKSTVTLGRRGNLLFMGTTVAMGEGFGVVIGTGMRTELGRIASLSAGAKSDASPLQKELGNVAKRIAQGTGILSVFLVAISLLSGLGVHDAFVFAIGIASAMIPQGLPAEVNVTLAQAANRLAKAKALVKKLSAVETLGATNLICTDKTGTLTKNEMTVEQLTVGVTPYLVSGTGYEAHGTILAADKKPLSAAGIGKLELFFATCVFASNATINPPDTEHPKWYCLGDPTEGSLITLARKAGIDDHVYNEQHKEMREFPFDSGRKMMSSVRRYNNRLTLFVKGAPEQVLGACDYIWDKGRIRKLTAADRTAIIKRNDELASGAMRNLALAYKLLPANTEPGKLTMEKAESGLVYVGMASMIDPPRDEVFEAMQAARLAHIPVTIVTGDNPLTASAIAVKVGLAKNAKELTIVMGEDLASLSDEATLRLLDKGQIIFSRVAPEDKMRIVDLAKSNNKVVAVTGDGINDAPALKRADIGVAMGITGTDVAKQSADIILLDDSFKTLVSAIQQGRVIFQNIRKATICAISSNGGELMVVLTSLAMRVFFNVPLAITAVQILCIDLVAELFPIAALGWDPGEKNLMKEPPRNVRRHILSRTVITDLVRTGFIMGGLAYANYLFFIWRHGYPLDGFSVANPKLYASATALTYVTICLCQFANILHRRVSPGQHIFTRYLWSNPHLLVAFGMSLTAILAIVYVPFVRNFIGTGPLSFADWFCALNAAVIFLAWRQLTSQLSSRKRARQADAMPA